MEYQAALKQPEIVEPVRKYRPTKNWIRASSKRSNKSLQMTNKCTESYYHRTLKEVKALFEAQGEFMFERDYKTDRDSGPLVMHELMCESMFLQLWCCYSDYYFINYHFDNCPFEQEIMAAFLKNHISAQMRHFPLPKGFFQRKIEQEDNKFFYTLDVETAE